MGTMGGETVKVGRSQGMLGLLGPLLLCVISYLAESLAQSRWP